MERCDREEIVLGAVLARKIWLHQNSVVYGDPFPDPAQIFREAKATVRDFYRLMSRRMEVQS
jgi:hypothetical protein